MSDLRERLGSQIRAAATGFSFLCIILVILSAPAAVLATIDFHPDADDKAELTVARLDALYRPEFASAYMVPTEGSGWDTTAGGTWKPSWQNRKARVTTPKIAAASSGSQTGDFELFEQRAAWNTAGDGRSRNSSDFGSYRTVCVRLCDGYFWPVSFSTTRASFGADARACRSSCGSPARLFYYANPGQGPVDMVDLKGRPYNRLVNAWRYQRQYVRQCKCKPDPWQRASRARHARYAMLQRQGKLKRYLARMSKNAERVTSRRNRLSGWNSEAVRLAIDADALEGVQAGQLAGLGLGGGNTRNKIAARTKRGRKWQEYRMGLTTTAGDDQSAQRVAARTRIRQPGRRGKSNWRKQVFNSSR